MNLDETARRIPIEEIQEVAGLISRADRVVMVGVDQMAFFASYLRHLLALLDLRAEVVASASQEALGTPGAHRRGDARDRLLAAGGRTRSCCVPPSSPASASARRSRSSDASISELTKISDHCLYYSSNSPSYTRSHAALLSLVQALAYAVYAGDEAAYRRADPGLQAEVGPAPGAFDPPRQSRPLPAALRAYLPTADPA